MRLLFWTILLVGVTAGCAADKPEAVPPPRQTAPPPSSVRPTPPAAIPAPGRDQPLKKRLPPPVLAPQVSHDQERELTQEARARIARVEETVAGLDPETLPAEDRETLGTIQTFLAKAKAALAEKDFPRAINLAEKAKVLADDLSNGRR
ncbi:hypothetical protein [Nitrospira sp. Kam-Ns4a]